MMVLSFFSITGVTAYAQESGNWDGVSYTLDDDGTLTISGTGVIPDNAFYNDSRVKKIVFNDDCDITSIGAQAFSLCNNCTSIEIYSQSVVEFGKECLVCNDENNKNLKSIAVYAKGVKLNNNRFYSFGVLETLIFSTEEPIDFTLNEFVYGMAVSPNITIPLDSRIVTPGHIVFSGDKASEYQQLFETAVENGYIDWIDNIIEEAQNDGCTYIYDSEPKYEIITQQNYERVFPKYATLNILGPHTHSFSYSASASTITAECSNSDGNCTLQNNKVTLIIKKPQKIKFDDGQSPLASFTGLNSFNS